MASEELKQIIQRAIFSTLKSFVELAHDQNFKYAFAAKTWLMQRYERLHNNQVFKQHFEEAFVYFVTNK